MEMEKFIELIKSMGFKAINPFEYEIDLSELNNLDFYEDDICGQDFFPGLIKIYLSKNPIEIECTTGYPNYRFEEDQEFHKTYEAKDYSDALEILKFLFSHNLITYEMVNTRRFSEGERLPKKYLEEDLQSFINEYGEEKGWKTQLKWYDFDSKEEYEAYLESPEMKALEK